MPIVKLINALFHRFDVEPPRERKRPRLELINRERRERREKKIDRAEHFDEPRLSTPFTLIVIKSAVHLTSSAKRWSSIRLIDRPIDQWNGSFAPRPTTNPHDAAYIMLIYSPDLLFSGRTALRSSGSTNCVVPCTFARYCPSQSVECWFYSDGSLDTVYRRITRRGQKTCLTRGGHNCKTLQTPITVERSFLVAFSSFVVFGTTRWLR